ncbi:excalibur calcium-binding domain-containing protein [Glycomyces tritici]|uniref:Excalibur calcium-binding domain-containing protein n=1 Tax=Glycomyces tritici TaxID=2665176 RepID=A0ABT7YVR9_9ACTN|nr:excalibur calcium-binding domain-containing protein [Glycomyces tritici]MDN3242464.1 excalibur calcium-binding domain-containing protein [Glycomyces tritici]
MTLVLGVIAISPAGTASTQDRVVAHDIELVDFQPLDTVDDPATMEESVDQTGTAVEPPMEDTGEPSAAATDPTFEYENCDAARDAGAAPVEADEYGFGPHLDGDDDGVGCENRFGAAQVPEGSRYPNCDAARDAGLSAIKEGEPGYAAHLDGDDDGVACE